MSSSGRPSRAAITAAELLGASISACGEEVEATTMSARSSAPGSSSKADGLPPKRCASVCARSRRRLATKSVADALGGQRLAR